MGVKRKIDFTNAGEGFKLIPEGTYVCHVFDVADKPSKKGDPGVNVTLKIAEEGDYKGQTLFYYLLEIPTTLWKVREFLEACGAAIPKKAVMVDYDKCLGKKVVVEVGHRLHEGKKYPEVKNIGKYEEAENGDGGDEGDEEEIPF